jgi:hypothetical protein
MRSEDVFDAERRARRIMQKRVCRVEDTFLTQSVCLKGRRVLRHPARVGPALLAVLAITVKTVKMAVMVVTVLMAGAYSRRPQKIEKYPCSKTWTCP